MPLTFRHIEIIFILCFLFSFSTTAQTDSSILFENQKGHLNYPLNNCSKKMDCRRSNEQSPPFTQITFLREKSEDVSAIFDGRVFYIKEIDSTSYLIITKFGDYFLSYGGVTKPKVKVGDFIYTGQKISTIAPLYEKEFELIVSLSKKDKDFDIVKWFKD